MGGSSAGRVKPPPPPAPAPMPMEGSAEYEQVRDAERRRRRRAAGYQKTLLTDNWALGASEGGKTLLG